MNINWWAEYKAVKESWYRPKKHLDGIHTDPRGWKEQVAEVDKILEDKRDRLINHLRTR